MRRALLARVPQRNLVALGALVGALAVGLVAVLPAAAAETMRGGTITYAKPGEMISLDPHTSISGVDWRILYHVYEQLVQANDDFSFAPGLATSWEQPSPTTYIFHLNPASTFSNGRPVVAADVVGSLKRVLDPETAAFWAVQLGTIKEIVADDDHTVRVVFERPHTPFLAAVSMITTSILPMKELNEGTFDPKAEMLGSGPFMVEEHLQDESWTLARNPHFWRAGYPIADAVKILIIPDDNSRIAALRDGRADLAIFENPDAELLLAAVDNVTTVVQETSNYYRVDINGLGNSVFIDKRVRQAMNLALDRDEISNVALAGAGAVDYPLPQVFPSAASCRAGSPSYTTPRAERLEQARALLKEAGQEGVAVELIASPVFPAFPLIAQVMQKNLAEIGMNVEIKQLLQAEWYDAVFSGKAEFDFALSYFAGYSDPSMVLAWWDPEISIWNKHFVESIPELASLLGEARVTPHGARREVQFKRICEIIDDSANMIAIATKNDIVAYRHDQVSVQISGMEGNIDTLKFIEEFARLK